MEECCFADAGSVLGCPSLVRWRYAELQEGHVCIEGVELPKDIDKGSTLQMPSFLCGKRVVSIGQGDSWTVDFPDLSAHNICKVIIPEGVQRLSGVLFRGCASIREIILPRTLRSIGSEVFSQCEAEIFACISDVRYIGSWCLGALDKTKNRYVIKDGIVGLADGAFAECHTAKQVVLPDSLLYIGKQAFKCCDNMASVCFPVALQSIGDEAFAGCVHLKRMDLPCASFLESISLGVNWNAVSADGDWGEPCLDDIDARQLSEESILSLKDAEIPSLLQLEKSLETWSHQRWRDVKCT